MKASLFGLIASLLAAQPAAVPNISDLKITLRRTSAWMISTEIVYFKGARQRRDSTTTAQGTTHTSTTLFDCQDRRRIMLNPDAHTYASVPTENMREHVARLKRTGQSNPAPEATGPEVTTTIDSVDTGERRQIGRYVARHVVTTITVDATPGASTQSSRRKQDGWYIDLPDATCSGSEEWTFATFALLSGYVVRYGQPPPPRDRERVQILGRARRGFAIEETDSSMKIELVDFSEAPLDDSVFSIPAHYRPALVTPGGGFDMTRPDTLLNRTELYVELVAAWVHSLFR